MKKHFIFLFLGMMAFNASFAKIWRVNNTGVPADFTTAQTANDAASVVNGDTIHFEPSGSNYGNLSLTKRLVIIGNGYFLGSLVTGSNPDLQANTSNSLIPDIYIFAGGSNSVIMGMTFNNAYIGYTTAVNNLMFRRNRVITLLYFYNGGSTNVQVLQCYIDGAIAQTSAHSNVLIANNIVSQGVTFDVNDDGTFQNNVFHTTGAYNSTFTNFTLRSNILISGNVTLTTCLVENNLANNTQFGNLTGNVQNVNMSSVFIGYPTQGATSNDGRWVLQNPGPAIATGYASVDCGPYGNPPTAYVKSGMPDVPSIYKLSVPPVVTNNNLFVTISTKINN